METATPVSVAPDGLPHDNSPSTSEKRARLSCVNCRKRKVKCDRREPFCTACEKHQEQCVYPLERKRVVRRSAYKDMAQIGALGETDPVHTNITHRLAKMERLISDFGVTTGSEDGASPAISDASLPDTIKREKSFKRNHRLMLPSPVEETDFAWEIPETDPSTSRDDLTKKIAAGHEEGFKGPCSLFSPKGMEWVNAMVGDGSFSQMLCNFKSTRRPRELEFDLANRHPLPPPEILFACVTSYLSTLNRDMILFQDYVIMDGLREYLAGKAPHGNGWYVAINIIVAHAHRNEPTLIGRQPVEDSDKFLYNVLAMLPSIILTPVNELTVGALLSTVLYFMFNFENQPSTSILSIALQHMTMARYNSNVRLHGCSEADFQLRRRLFWNGYVLDMDHSLRLGKPTSISPSINMNLPEAVPADGIGVHMIGGVQINFLREHVLLAKIQGKLHERLYSEKSLSQSPEQLYANIDELDDDLQAWKENSPDVLRPMITLDRSNYENLIFLTVLHYTYFQLIIAVHSVVFHGFAAHNADDRDERIIGSVALCVGAARASIALLNHHDNTHPFTRYLVNHVAWSVDILFMNILQNKSSPKVFEDLKLLQRLVEYYENYDAERDSSVAYKMTKAMYTVASRAIVMTQNAAPSIDEQLSGLGLHNSPPCNPLPELSLDALVEPATASNGFPANNINYPNGGAGVTGNGFSSMPFLESEWMMPLGFQPEYWQDPWANVFQDPDLSDLA
ncbi:hypothetical protein HYALB_00009704 [Hymenoscyphus albidus]|uniref:Zn(2)-C6 fungal-type domain-containing protein n=1 Tax=Hymenoscyphus albidus TaxID=595503 RepID=A0A9N9LIH4_9HELO|nr:hypothetical protein HYALB_00009704 [Hymenoscyphus albidus]